MRLKCIKLAGFKSFVDPTTVPFPSNLCAVVGPNGCGKSNVIDAVRWVMGESSAKNLRGESMTDVIFNGANTRKPVGQASIELVFDNSDGTITGEYARFNEISVKRKVTRDAQNSYYLNGQKCRRRDITDIFLGTGLGPRSYAIIEQGMISRLIEAKPEELRVYIEEAAGISKYKERRRDTENRMNRTRENMERLTDIRDELERQLSRLERQSEAAEKYTVFKKDERSLKANLQALRYNKLDKALESQRAESRDLEMEVEAKVTEQVSFDTDIEKLRLEHTESNDKFNDVQGRFYQIGADISRIEQTIQHAQERSRQLHQDLEETDRQCKETEEHLVADKEKAEGWESELLELEPELEMLTAAEESSGENLMVAEESMQDWQARWDEFNLASSQPRQQAEVEQSKIQHLDQAIQRMRDRTKRLEEEKENLSIGSSDDDIVMLTEQMAELDLEHDEKQQRLDNFNDTLEGHREKERNLGSELDSSRGELQRLRGRQSSLEALQQAALGEGDSGVQRWLESQGLADNPRLADSMQTETGWEVATETVLGRHLQAVCVDDLDAASQLLGDFSKGEMLLLDTKTQPANSGDKGTLLSSKVTASADVAALMGGVYAADDLAAALALRGNLNANESVVTKDGIWLGPNWLRVAKDVDATAGVLQRKQELETLTADIEVLDEKVEALSAQRDEAREAVKQQEAERENLRREVAELSRRHGEVRSQLSAKQVRVEQFNARRERTNNEIKETQEQITLEQEKLSESRINLEQAIEAMERDTDQREALLSERDSCRAALDQARQSARHDKDKAHELAMRHQSVKTQLDSIRSSMERLRVQVQRLQERKDQLQASLVESSDPSVDHKVELEEKLELKLEVEESLNEARRKVQEVEHNLREVEQRRHSIELVIQEVRSKLEQSRLGAQTLEVQRKTIHQQLLEDNFDLEGLLQNLPEEADEKEWELELERIGNRISRLGPINLAAIEEYKMESERKVYLDEQFNDLTEALEMLENAIIKIDKETRTRFKETFDYVNKGLQELFPKVFGGGHAYLELTGDDMLDTGIAIMARPPGKRNSTIHLLSGGEKALTAIALVFSIFRLNPAPFCMLDEVDAPLDDANVGRYARIVKEMSDQVQFIYITHNKIAMEMAEQLMGVTMHEPGVSRLVSVDVNEAAELAAM
ncbi:MAG: chromosome segregation protein SMC [Cellvibrionaceae bacterium]